MKSILLGLALLATGCADYGLVYRPQSQYSQQQYQAQQHANYCNQLRSYNQPTMNCTTYGSNTTCQMASTPALTNSGC